MATVPAVAYLGDRYTYTEYTSRWTPPFLRLADFQQGQIGDTAQNDISGLDDGFDGKAHNSTYSDEVTFQGRQVCKCFLPQFTRSDTGGFGGSFTKEILVRKGEPVWSRALVFIPESFDFDEADGGGAMKFMRLRVPGVGHQDIYINSPAINRSTWWYFTSETMNHNGDFPRRGFVDRAGGPFPKDQWLDVQYRVTYDTVEEANGGKCEVYFWINGQLQGYANDVYTLLSDSEEANSASFITYFNSTEEGVSKDMWLYIAEYEVTNVPPEHFDINGNRMLASKV